MKKIFAMLMAAMIVLSLGAFVVSAEFVESPGHNDENEGENVIITHIGDIANADPRVDRDNFQTAADELKNADDLSKLCGDIKNKATVRDVYDVTFVDGALESDGKTNVTLGTNFTDDNYQVIIRTADGWKVIPSVRNADGTVTVALTGNAVVAFLSVPAQTGSVTPPTGDGIATIVACLVVVAVAGSAVLLRRKNLEK